MKKKQLLNEIMGVPRVIDYWVEIFSLIITGISKKMIDDGELDQADVDYVDENGEEKTGDAYRYKNLFSGKEFTDLMELAGDYSSLSDILKDPNFQQFPLYRPTLDITLYFLPDELYELETEGKEGFIEAFHSFDSSKKALSKMNKNNIFVNQGFGFQIYQPTSQLENFDINKFRKGIKSVISHELLHAYETYNRVLRNEDPFQGRESMLNTATKLMSDFKYPQWQNFLHLVYLHLSFEINARVTQFYYEMKEKDIKSTSEFMTELKNSSVWKELTMLENFSAENFISNFKIRNLEFDEILKDMGAQIQRQNQGLASISIKNTPSEGMRHLIQGWDYTLQRLSTYMATNGIYKGKLMDMVPEKAVKNPYYFFKFFENRFHKKAENFKRKLLRISSLVLDNNSNPIKEEFNEFGFDTEIDPVMEFLYNKFMECKLEKVGSKNWVGWTKYVDKSGKILFLDNINTGDKNTVLSFDNEIYKKLEKMGLNYEEMKKLCISMLYETHKRKVLTATRKWPESSPVV
jgi:hypothetical protein